MYRILTILMLSLAIVSSCKYGERSKLKYIPTINAEKYGLKEGQDATMAIYNAINAAKKHGADTLSIPKGTYHFYPGKAFEDYVEVSNNDNSLKRIAFPFYDIENLVLEGNNSMLIFHGHMEAFELNNCKNITIENITIDWETPLYGQARVVNVNPQAHTFDLAFKKPFKYEVRENNLYVKYGGKMYNMANYFYFDEVTKSPPYNVNKYVTRRWDPGIDTLHKAEEIQDGIVRMHLPMSALPKKGWYFVIKGHKDARLSPAIHLFKAFNIKLKNVDIHHAGGMGLIAERSGDISLDDVNVILHPEKDWIVSTTADATHFVNCKGHIDFRNCIFENMMDDATNVHGIYVKVAEVIDSMTLGASVIHKQQKGFYFAGEGDTLRIVDQKSLLPGDTLIVEKTEHVNEEYLVIKFKNQLSDVINTSMALENLTWNASATMKQCTVRQNRARSVLFSTPKKVLLENNYFSSMMAGVLVASDCNYWCESGAVYDLTIRNNIFEDHCSGGKNQAVFMVMPHARAIKKEGYIHHNIVFEGNTIKTFDTRYLQAKSVSNLIFSGNTIVQTNTYKPMYPDSAGIFLNHCKNVIIKNNTYKGGHPVEINTIDTKDVLLESNNGFSTN